MEVGLSAPPAESVASAREKHSYSLVSITQEFRSLGRAEMLLDDNASYSGATSKAMDMRSPTHRIRVVRCGM